MSVFSQNNLRAVETFLVAATTEDALPAADTLLTDSSTGAVNLNDGQLGIFQAYPMDGALTRAYHAALDAADEVVDAPWIQIYQGTADSANPAGGTATYPLWVRPYEASQVIVGSNNLVVTKQAPVAPTISTWVVGVPGGTGAITALDNTEYAMSIAYRGRMMDELYSPEATNHFNPSYLTPNYTTLGTAEPEDHLIQNLCWVINRNSKALAVNRTKFRGSEPVIALAVMATSPTAGAEIGGAVDPLLAGDFLPIVNTNVGVRGITLTQAQVTSIQNAAVAATGAVSVAALDANILTIDLTTAGTTTGGVADMIILLALDRDQAFEDRVPQVKTRLQVGLTRGFDFNLVYNNEEVFASEGQGQGRWLDLWYKATHGQRKYNLDHTLDPVIEFPSPIDTADSYFQYTIIHEDVNQVNIGGTSVSPMREILLIPEENTNLVTAFEAVLDPWVASANGVGIVEA